MPRRKEKLTASPSPPRSLPEGQAKMRQEVKTTAQIKIDNLDLQLSDTPLFVSPIRESTVRTITDFRGLFNTSSSKDLFALDSFSDSDSMSDSSSSSSSMEGFKDLDDCINQSNESKTLSISSLIHGRKPKRQKTEDLRPIAFVRFNTRLGKPKPVTICALLDSGGSESLVTKKFVQKLRLKKSQKTNTVWTTPGGAMNTNQKVKAQFTLPELHDDQAHRMGFTCHQATWKVRHDHW